MQFGAAADGAEYIYINKNGGVLKSMLPEKIKRHQGKELYD